VGSVTEWLLARGWQRRKRAMRQCMEGALRRVSRGWTQMRGASWRARWYPGDVLQELLRGSGRQQLREQRQL